MILRPCALGFFLTFKLAGKPTILRRISRSNFIINNKKDVWNLMQLLIP